jgi:hypothetical protein
MSRNPILAAGLVLSLSLSAGAAFAQAAAKAKFSSGSTMGELIANAEAKAILNKHLDGIADNPEMSQAASMSLKDLQQFIPTMDEKKLKEIDADLAKVGAAKK